MSGQPAAEVATCLVCHRPLTNPESVAARMGPVCSGRSGNGTGEGVMGGRLRAVKGARGSTDPTLKAFAAYLKRKAVSRVIVVSYQRPGDDEHVFNHGLIAEEATGKLVVFADGFASNYGGSGPKGLAYALTAAGMPAAIASLRLDGEHAHALFDGKLAPGEVMHLVRDLSFAVQPQTGMWAAFAPGEQAGPDLLVIQSPPRQLTLTEALAPTPEKKPRAPRK